MGGFSEPLFTKVPADMIQHPQLVCWKSVPKPGATKPTKIPIDPHTGREAKVNDPDTWADFNTAVKAYLKNKGLAGVGFIFTREDPYSGIDYDNCRDPETGALNSSAVSAVRKAGTYAEVSPSGTGIELFGGGCSQITAARPWRTTCGERECSPINRHTRWSLAFASIRSPT